MHKYSTHNEHFFLCRSASTKFDEAFQAQKFNLPYRKHNFEHFGAFSHIKNTSTKLKLRAGTTRNSQKLLLMTEHGGRHCSMATVLRLAVVCRWFETSQPQAIRSRGSVISSVHAASWRCRCIVSVMVLVSAFGQFVLGASDAV